MLERERSGNHSVFAYLGRRETETLVRLLEFYLQQEISEYHGEIIRVILEILLERENGGLSGQTAEMLVLYERMYYSGA